MKKLIAILLAAIMTASFVACGKDDGNTEETKATTKAAAEATVTEAAPAVPQGKVLNIYAWNTEFQDRFNEYYQVPDGITVNWIINPSTDGVYQNVLDEALLNQDKAADDDKVDIFLIEADNALKYVSSGYCADVYKDIGITEADTANQYQYTKDFVTDADGNLCALSWQACPGGLIYRRSIAKDVLGTDDPEKVQEALSDWDKYNKVQADMKAKGYYMTSSYCADYRVYSNNVSSPWVIDGKINIDPMIDKWIDQTASNMKNGYTLPYGIWDAESFAEAKKDGKAFCWFGPGWFFDFCLSGPTLDNPDAEAAPGNGSYGDFAVCKGPQGFFWGGTWICGAKGSDNLELVKDIMKKMTCDKDTLVAITDKFNDFTNHVTAMEEKAADTEYGNAFLGGQNFIAQLADSAKSIELKYSTAYDQLLNEKITALFLDYFNGTITKEQAWDNFYASALESFPDLSK